MPALLGEDNGHAAPTPSEMGAAHDSKTMCALHMPLLEWVQHTTSRALCMPLIGWVCTLCLKRLGALRMPLIQQAQAGASKILRALHAVPYRAATSSVPYDTNKLYTPYMLTN